MSVVEVVILKLDVVEVLDIDVVLLPHAQKQPSAKRSSRSQAALRGASEAEVGQGLLLAPIAIGAVHRFPRTNI